MKLLITTQAIDKNDPILGFFHGWLEEFAKHFERIDVICLNEGEHTLPSNVFVHSLGKNEGKGRLTYTLRFFKYFIHIFVIQRVDYVFFHMGAIYNIMAAPFFVLRKITRTEFFWWKTHGKVRAFKEKLALFFCDRVYTAGSKSFDVATKKLRIIGHAIDIEQFVNRSGGKRDTKKCIMVGRLVRIKKIEIALEVVRTVAETTSGITLDVIGDSDTVDYKLALETYCKEQNLNQVHFLGSRPNYDMPSIYHHANVLLHPAYEAGFDKVVLEAMFSGVVPLTSIPSFQPVLSQFGLYIEPNDVKGYATQIERILHMEPHERMILGKELQTIVREHHSLSTLPKRIFNV